MGLPPGPRLPPLLNGIRFARDPLLYLPRLRARYGDLATVRFPDFGRVVYVSDPALVKQIFTGSPDVLHAGEANATVLEPAVGPGSVLTLDGAAHLRQRKLLLAPFHGRAIERYRSVIVESTRRDLETWPVGRPFALREHTQRITLDVILRAVYGLDGAAELADAHEVVSEFASASDALVLPSFMRRFTRRGPWARFLRSREALDRLVFATIAQRRAAGDAEERDDVLSLLMRSTDEDGEPLTDQELRDELVTVVGAGHETTATALAWALERLLRHPAAWDRLRDGLDESDEYLDAVIRETLRLRPVIVDVARMVKQRPLALGGYEIPVGTIVLAAITALHYREDIYPDAHAFRPERWLEGGASESYAWIPFGGGVRRCLGAAFAQEEMRIILREIASRAELDPVGSPHGERVRMRNITLAPDHGTRVALREPLRPAATSAPAKGSDDRAPVPDAGPRLPGAAV